MLMLTSILPAASELPQLDWLTVVQTAALIAIAILAVGALLRSLFGKESPLVRSVAAVLTIAMVYLAVILLFLFFPSLRSSVNHLPFLTVTQERFILWDLVSLPGEMLYPALLQLMLLAFLVNAVDDLLPDGKKFFEWYFWRTLTVLATLLLYLVVCHLANTYVPQLFTTWAKPVVLTIIITVVVVALLKLLLTAVLAAMNPVVGALYGFFFLHSMGREFSKSILSTLLFCGVLLFLNSHSMSQFAFADFSLAAFGPSCVVILFVLYVFGRLL